MPNRSLSSVMYDPGGLALPAPMDPGGLAMPSPIDPGGMALPAPTDPGGMAQPVPQASSWQNPAASMAPGAIANAPRMVQGPNGWELHEHGNVRYLQPHEVEPTQRNYVDEFWRKYGANNGNTWGSGDAAVDPYMGQIPFPEGRGPAFGEGPPGGGGMSNWVPGPDGIPVYTPNPNLNRAMGSASGNPYGQFTSGPHRAGSLMGGAVGGAMRGPMPGTAGSAIGGAFGLFGGGGQNAGRVQQTWGWGGRNANRTLGELTNSPGGTDSSYLASDPTLLR